jgi:uncharacterized protein YgbK (DUF1537 family)
MIRVGIVADDLTGAADTASQFVRAGWNTELQLRPGASAAQVLAVTTDSRNLGPAEAAKAVGAAVTQLRDAGVTHLYKKIDSTLRGQIRAEVRAAVDAWSPDAIAVVCPAFPELGRTLIDGRLCVNGVPVSKTALGNDPITPVAESHVPTLLGAAHVAQMAGEAVQSLSNRIKASAPLVVVDAAGEDDLGRIAEAVALLGPHVIPVGSAGLARHLARAWSFKETVTLRPSPVSSALNDLVVKDKITIVIVTSLQDVARRQAAAVSAAGAVHREPAPADLIEDDSWARWSSKILDSIGMESTLLLTAPLDRLDDLPPDLIPGRFADLTARLVWKAGAGASGVVVTGGDGARAVAHALNATGFQILGEVTSGVPVGTLVGGPANGLRFVTKAGGFGDADTLLQAVRAIGATEVAPYRLSRP